MLFVLSFFVLGIVAGSFCLPATIPNFVFPLILIPALVVALGTYRRSGQLRGRVFVVALAVVLAVAGSYCGHVAQQLPRTASESVGGLLTDAREAASRFVDSTSLGPSQRALVKAMALGIRDEVDDHYRSLYRESGSSHLLALSGLHLGILMSVMGIFITMSVSSRRLHAAVVCLVMVTIWGYALLAGMPYSLVRSTLMATLMLVAGMMGRRPFSLKVLLTAALAIVTVSPRSIFDVGMQLSFTAVLSIALFYQPLTTLVAPRRKWAKGVWGLLCVSLVAWLGTMPLVVYCFHNFQPWSPLLSMVFVPATTVLMYALLPYCLLHWCGWGLVATPIAWLIDHLYEWQWWLMGRAAVWPGVHHDGVWLSGYGVLLVYAVMGLLAAVVSVRRVFRPRLVTLMVVVMAGIPVVEHLARSPKRELIFYKNYHCPTAHFILSQDSTYLLPARSDSVWLYLQYEHDHGWAFHGLSTPIRLDHRPDLCRDGMVRMGGVTLLQIHDMRWLINTPDTLTVDYLHICHGYYGGMSELASRFRPSMVVLDASLGWRRARFLHEQCDSLGLSVWDIRQQGELRASF